MSSPYRSIYGPLYGPTAQDQQQQTPSPSQTRTQPPAQAALSPTPARDGITAEFGLSPSRDRYYQELYGSPTAQGSPSSMVTASGKIDAGLMNVTSPQHQQLYHQHALPTSSEYVLPRSSDMVGSNANEIDMSVIMQATSPQYQQLYHQNSLSTPSQYILPSTAEMANHSGNGMAVMPAVSPQNQQLYHQHPLPMSGQNSQPSKTEMVGSNVNGYGNGAAHAVPPRTQDGYYQPNQQTPAPYILPSTAGGSGSDFSTQGNEAVDAVMSQRQNTHYQLNQQSPNPQVIPGTPAPMVFNGHGLGTGATHGGPAQYQSQYYQAPQPASNRQVVSGTPAPMVASGHADNSVPQQHPHQYYQELRMAYGPLVVSNTPTLMAPVKGIGTGAMNGVQPQQIYTQAPHQVLGQHGMPGSTSPVCDTNGNGSGSTNGMLPPNQSLYSHIPQQAHSQNLTSGSSGQMLSVNSSDTESVNGGSPLFHHRYASILPEVPNQRNIAAPSAPMLRTNGSSTGFLNGFVPQNQSQLSQQLANQHLLKDPSNFLPPGNGNVAGMTTNDSPQHQQRHYQPVQHAGPPPVFKLPPFSLMRNVSSQPEFQQHSAQIEVPDEETGGNDGSPLVHDDNGDDVFAVEDNTEVTAVEEQCQHLWYWIEIIKLMTFHDCWLPAAEASRLATIYLSHLPTTHPIHQTTAAHSSITQTLLAESASLLRYLILSLLFPLLRTWTSTSYFRTYFHRPNTTRTQRLAFWREKASSVAEVHPTSGLAVSALEKFTEVLDTVLDRKWVYGVGEIDPADRNSKTMRLKMQGYLMWKFVLSADAVYQDLILRLETEPYRKKRWEEVHYPNMLPKLMAINSDPLLVPFIVKPEDWPTTVSIDEDVMHRITAVVSNGLD